MRRGFDRSSCRRFWGEAGASRRTKGGTDGSADLGPRCRRRAGHGRVGRAKDPVPPADLRQRFGPEYRRILEERRSRRHTEAELARREARHARLAIRPLTSAARDRYAEAWAETQRRFVDDPVGAVTEGDRLITTCMEERGYPVEDFDQRAADLSVRHAHVIANYRDAHDISDRSGRNAATTEELRRAMLLYRSLFDDLLGVPPVPDRGPRREPRQVAEGQQQQTARI